MSNTISMPLLLIILTSMGLVSLHNLQSSYAGTEDNEIQTEPNGSEGSGEQQQQQGEQESAETDTGEESNATSTVPSPEAVTTTPSDLIPGNQTTNQTEETSKPRMFERQLSPDVLKDLQILTPPPPYMVRVVFDSMTVHNDHEGTFSGDGEYDIAAYVQGIKVGLTDASGPGDGLWDVSSGETVTFDPGTEVTVDIPSTIPLSIFTVGSEVDGCDRTVFPRHIQETLNDLLRIPTGLSLLLGNIRDVHDDINKAINWVGCKLNSNDILGLVNTVYEPTAYGAGSHAEKSDKGDFTLKYTIGVTAPPPPEKEQTGLGPKVLGPEKEQTGLGPNKFSSQLNNDLGLEPEADPPIHK